MRRSIIKIAVALLTFVVGVLSAYFVWLNRARPTPRQTTHEVEVSKPAPARPAPAATPAEQKAIPIEEGWARLTTAEFCFFGMNMYSPGEEDEDPSAYSEIGGIFRPDGWMPSLKTDERAGVEFLIRQIPDRSVTKAHVDPLGMALKGELAVYCLQHIMKLNWYELKPDYETQLKRAVARDPGQSQSVLQRIIRSRSGSKELMKLWASRYENLKPPPATMQ